MRRKREMMYFPRPRMEQEKFGLDLPREYRAISLAESEILGWPY